MEMKATLASTGLLVVFCGLAGAQDTTGDRVVVPARNTSRARVINCNVANGNITIKTHIGADVIIEEPSGTRAAGPAGARDGMKRLDVPLRGLEVVEDDNVITVRNRFGGRGNLVITVPADTSLHLKSMNGGVNVDGVHGEVSVHTLRGHITLDHISGTVTADSLNGPIHVVMDAVDASKPMAFSTLNAPIDVTFPPDLKADLAVKAIRGPVYSDFDVTLGARHPITEKSDSSDMRFVIRIDRNIAATINGGGAQLTFRTLNGAVYIRKKK
jgi:DUF4097 and DUF4098 domain-containing protein YvlB